MKNFLNFHRWFFYNLSRMAKGKMDIFFTNLLDKNSINITKSVISNDIISHGNCISPDGQSIVFTSDRDGNKDIYFMTINGLEIEKLTLDKADDYEPTISPDGEYIIFYFGKRWK